MNHNDEIPDSYRKAAPPSPDFLSAPEHIAQGEKLYLKHCALCHGKAGYGEGSGGKSSPLRPSDLTSPYGTASKPLNYWFWRISEGGAAEPFHSQGSIMPPWEYHLSALKRWQIIVFSLTLSKKKSLKEEKIKCMRPLSP